MQTPSTIQDIEALIRDRVQEHIHLDYKDSSAIGDDRRHEISKDVSAFANSDGGVLIYGVEEDQHSHLPIRIDGGIDDQRFSREWLEQIIMSKVTPIIDGVRIIPISVGPGKSLYIVEVPKSHRAPHQAADKKYYKRNNFVNQPMEDYEINDVRNRRYSLPPLLTFEVFDWKGFVAAFDVTNVGEIVAEDVSFEFAPPIPWPTNRPRPQLFDRGIRRFPPRQRLRFLYFPFPEILNGSAGVPDEFEVRIKYFHPDARTTITDVWPVSFGAFEGSIVMRSEMEEHAKDLVEGVKSLTQEVKKLQSTLDGFKTIVGSTGIDLSIPALRNLGRVLRQGSPPERIHPKGANPNVFREVLGVDVQMAYAICNSIGYTYHPALLKDIPGMTPELIERIRTAFIIDELPDQSPKLTPVHEDTHSV
jgi:hypothetical protein